jgi:hypothetical protein
MIFVKVAGPFGFGEFGRLLAMLWDAFTKKNA